MTRTRQVIKEAESESSGEWGPLPPGPKGRLCCACNLQTRIVVNAVIGFKVGCTPKPLGRQKYEANSITKNGPKKPTYIHQTNCKKRHAQFCEMTYIADFSNPRSMWTCYEVDFEKCHGFWKV
eukprot:5407363-Amphidinium_carterae.1